MVKILVIFRSILTQISLTGIFTEKRGFLPCSARLFKELKNFEEIIQVYETHTKDGFSCFIHSDMRAHRNPTRRKVIRSATQNLIQQLKSLCPKCAFPGFIKNDHEYGLPCSNCLKPTKSICKTFIQCKKCSYCETVDYPTNKFFEDPQFCDYCNP